MGVETAEFLAKGIDALQHDHYFLALACFEQAAKDGVSPAIGSYLAYCRAKTKGGFPEAIALAEASIAGEPENGAHFLNLGRIHLLGGNRQEAIEIFRKGVSYDMSGEILLELERLGVRKPPVFPSLHRAHPLNRIFGLFMARLGMR